MRPRRRAFKDLTPNEVCFFEQVWLVQDFTEQLCKVMKKQKITRAALARRLKVTKGYITQLLAGENVTLRSAARIAFALDMGVDLTLVRRSR